MSLWSIVYWGEDFDDKDFEATDGDLGKYDEDDLEEFEEDDISIDWKENFDFDDTDVSEVVHDILRNKWNKNRY